MDITKSLIPQIISMTSLEIANLTQARHDSVKRTIEFLVKDGIIVQPHHVDEQITDKMGRKRKQLIYRFEGEQGKRDCFVAVGRVAPKFMAAVFDRWLYLEGKEKGRLQNAKVWHIERDSTKINYKDMSKSLVEHRKRQNKETEDYHFATEANMLNRIIIGCTASQFKEHLQMEEDASIRDKMEAGHLIAYTYLQNANTMLLDMNMPYHERKDNLMEVYQTKFAKLPYLNEVKQIME